MAIIAFLIGIGIAGIALIIAGATTTNDFWKVVVSAIGGTLLGVSFGGILSAISSKTFESRVVELLKSFSSNRLSSPDDIVATYRKRFYHYNVTQMYNQHHWRLAIYDFRKIESVGELLCLTHYTDKSGHKQDYSIRGAIRDSRLILFIKQVGGREDTAIEIIPFVSDTYRHCHCGFWLMVTWDGNHALLPTILSETPLHGWNREGDIPESLSDALNETWKDGIKQLSPVLPLPEGTLADSSHPKSR